MTAVELLIEQVTNTYRMYLPNWEFPNKEYWIEMEKQQMNITDEQIDNAVVKEYENVGDEKLFPNHTDKDIWMNGFYEGAKWYREKLKRENDKTNR